MLGILDFELDGERSVGVVDNAASRWSCSPTSRMTLRGGTMKTVILDVRTPSESMGDFLDSWKTGKPQKSARISFATPQLLGQGLISRASPWPNVLCGTGPG